MATEVISWNNPRMSTPLIQRLLPFAARLRFPYLFALFLALFVLDLLIPDMIPFADEILFGLLALLFASVRKRVKP
jgi:hypothetical protein